MAGVVAGGGIIDAALRSQAMTGVIDTTFRNSEVLGLFPPRPLTGGATFNIKMLYGFNSSVGSYVEGDAVGVAGSQSYLTAQWPVTYYKVVTQITGHANDQLKGGNPSAVFFNQLELEFVKGMEDLIDKASNDALGTGLTAPVGIQGVVDSAGTIAGVNRSTFTWFGAYETTDIGTTIALADLDNAEQNSRDSDNASNFDEYWTSWKQLNKYKQLVASTAGTSNSILINAADASANGIRLPSVSTPNYIGQRMIRPIRDLTNSIWMGVTRNLLFLGVQRETTTVPLGITDDSTKFLTTMAVGIGTDNPRKHWKVTGFTA
jgi:hypothetical protein